MNAKLLPLAEQVKLPPRAVRLMKARLGNRAASCDGCFPPPQNHISKSGHGLRAKGLGELGRVLGYLGYNRQDCECSMKGLTKIRLVFPLTAR